MRSNKGFTLVEMAIVLIIIGIILGAVVKGQDLIVNARSKKLISAANTWNILAYTYMDRMGHFPGDGGTNVSTGVAVGTSDGIIGNAAAERAAGATAIDQIVGTAATPNMSNAPENPVMIGGQAFWIYFGYVNATVGQRNAIYICPSVNCNTALTSDSMAILQALDTAIDGTADAGLGRVRAMANGGGYNALAVAFGNRANAVFNNSSPLNRAIDTPVNSAQWAIAGQSGAVWVFDRPF